MPLRRCWLAAAAALWLLPAASLAQSADERPAKLSRPTQINNFERRAIDIAMRDGVKLHTIILIPRGATRAPMLLTRTPYDADKQTRQHPSTDLATNLDGYDNPVDTIVDGGYIRVIQDVRGKYGSEGIYMMNPPLAKSKWNPTPTDDSTDAYDTIDWLVKHVPESNGKVGVLGISYDGFTPLMALINPHPALKVAVPMNPMVDGWRGDDWFHNGAFRQINLPYIWEQVATKDNTALWANETYDDYDQYMRAGSAGALAKRHGLDQIGFWRKVAEHPAYDAFWQDQAMDKILGAQPVKVPVMLVHGLWDQEDIYGPIAVYRALMARNDATGKVFLSIGPWFHGQQIEEGSRLGNIHWDQETAKWWRAHVLAPFLAHYLKDDAPATDVAPVTAFKTGTNEWQRLQSWPAQPATKALYLKPGGALGFAPAPGRVQTSDYISDPANPVTYIPRPMQPVGYEDEHWTAWLTTDQRAVSGRPDVLTFTSEPLTAPMMVAGAPQVNLTAATSGTDSDWVVKLIDVYPDQVAGDHKLGGYELAVSMDILRGRYRESFAVAKPIQPNRALKYQFALPAVNHVFLPGHRIMVQVQSSWFPLYDRNPQKFVPNIMFAKPADYVKAQQRVVVSGPEESFVSLPVQ